MIKKLEQKGVKTILWLTGAVNLKSKDTSLQKCETYDFVRKKKLGINNSMPMNGGKDMVFI